MSINDDLADSEYGDDFIEQEESFSDTTSEKYDAKADKRAHHNALERKRRDHIKDSFSNLKNAVPTFSGEKASRATILKKAAEYINTMRTKNNDHQRDIDQLKKENKILEEKIVRALEQMKNGVSSNNSTIELNEKTNYGHSFHGNIVELDASLANCSQKNNSHMVIDEVEINNLLDSDPQSLSQNSQLTNNSNQRVKKNQSFITNNSFSNLTSNSPKRQKKL